MNIIYDIQVGNEMVTVTGTDKDSGMSVRKYVYKGCTEFSKYRSYMFSAYISMTFVKGVIEKEMKRRLTNR